MRILLVFLAILMAVSAVDTAHVAAQVSGLDAQNVRIDASPRFPEPGEEVTLTLNAYTINTHGSGIRWYVDGKEEIAARNTRTLSVTAGRVGEQQSITVEIIATNGSTRTISHTVRPSRIDTIIEADTLVPPFYQGRAVPSIGSQVRVVAIPELGNTSPKEQYAYLWKLDNAVLFGGSIKGKYVAEFEAPAARESIVSVDVIDQTGQTVASESIIIPYTEPELHFYIDNPLRGVSHNAIGRDHLLVGQEATVRAEPYFMARNIFAIEPLLEWRIDGQVVDNQNEDPQSITLQKVGERGEFQIGFHIRNLAQLLQGAEGEFKLQF